MIKTLLIENFQSHEDAELELHSGVNVIVGPSDTGKSALLRALRWVVDNRPAGTAFRSHWCDDTTDTVCSVVLDDGSGIVRSRNGKTGGKGVNEYIVIDTDENELTLKALGKGVPEEVTQLVNFGALNMQSQHDGVFLLQSTPGEVARKLNEVCNLDEIDTSLTKAESLRRAASQDVERAKNDLDTAEAALQTYDWIDNADAVVADLEARNLALLDLERRRNALYTLINSVLHTQRDTAQVAQLCEADETLTTAEQRRIEYDALMLRHNRLHRACYLIRETTSQRDSVTTLLSADTALTALEDERSSHHALTTKRDTLAMLVSQTRDTQRAVNDAHATIEARENEFNEAFPETCPLCGMGSEQ